MQIRITILVLSLIYILLIEVFKNIEKMIKIRIGSKPIELKTSYAIDIPSVLYGDKNKLQQIITNLLTNAVKYTEKGTVNFDVQCINEKVKSKILKREGEV